MEAKELMIGDLVKVIHIDGSSDFAYVSQVGTEEIKARDKNGYLQRYVRSRFEPIPLTEKVLMANFEWNDLGRYDIKDKEYASKGGYLIARLDKVTECTLYSAFSNMSVNVRYVHELQHALRLCGLNDLADNLIVPKCLFL